MFIAMRKATKVPMRYRKYFKIFFIIKSLNAINGVNKFTKLQIIFELQMDFFDIFAP